jgi:acetyltransferase-like isoleucine patch superfamily enzyme
MGLRRGFRGLFDLANWALIRVKYNGWTIAEYFRKQGARIGENCFIQVRFLSTEPYLINIGNNVWIAPNVVFHTHEGGTWICSEEGTEIEVFGKIVIEDKCMIGACAHLLPNIRIGRNSIVGAGSVVITDVPPDSIVMGVPARVIGSSEKFKAKCIERWKEQKPPDYKGSEQGKDAWAYKGYKDSRQILRQHLERLFDIHPPH